MTLVQWTWRARRGLDDEGKNGEKVHWLRGRKSTWSPYAVFLLYCGLKIDVVMCNTHGNRRVQWFDRDEKDLDE